MEQKKFNKKLKKNKPFYLLIGPIIAGLYYSLKAETLKHGITYSVTTFIASFLMSVAGMWVGLVFLESLCGGNKQ